MIGNLRSSAYRHLNIRYFRSKSLTGICENLQYSKKCFSSNSWNWSKSSSKETFQKKDAVDVTPDDISDSIPVLTQNEILETCTKLHSSIMPINSKINGPLAKHSDKGTSLPFVFLVGNHSSGKSSFINYVLGRNVQTTGVAPTDDSFTIIAPGPNDSEKDGPSLIGDPDMGFSQLRQFGPTLIHHTQLKVRAGTKTPGFMIVDSPGMIDSPVNQSGMPQSYSTPGQSMDRGYDFQGVVRWYAERADVVLVLFDPSKPGTTGETLNVLLNSLGGMDHKLLIVLNKADEFKKIHDFARAYGSLCWNLSKVIPRKDLPRIFTMCLPVKNTDGHEATAVGAALADLEQTRDDVVAEVMKAPKRRVDNMITHLNDSIHLLLMHIEIAQDVQKKYNKLLWEHRVQELGSLTAGVGLGVLGFYASVPVEFTGAAIGVTLFGVGGMKWFNNSKLKEAENQLLTSEELSAAFQRTHSREISQADEFTASVWQRIREHLRMALKSEGLASYPSVSKSEIHHLRNILEEEIPKLRDRKSVV